MSKTIKIGGRIESAERGGVVTGANAILDDTKGKKQNVINSEVSDELVRIAGVAQGLSDTIEAILVLIPSAASALNKLADMAFVNSSVSTNTATFRGTSEAGLTEQQFLAWADGLTHDINDYVFWNTVDADGNVQFKRYKYDGTQWLYEYTLNNSSFTAAQWAAINSGITTALVAKLNDLPTNAALQAAFSAITAVIPSDATAENKLTDKAYVDGLIQAIEAIIPAEASSTNKLADKEYVGTEIAAAILAAIPSFKGQFTSLVELQAVQSPKDGDFGIVRTTDKDGRAVYSFYQYKNESWNAYYTLQYQNQRKPASTGLTGNYPSNGMGRIELPRNEVEIYPLNTWGMVVRNGISYLVYSYGFKYYAVYDSVSGKGLGLENNLVSEVANYNIADIADIVETNYLNYSEAGGVFTITKPDTTTITSIELNNTELWFWGTDAKGVYNVLTQSMISTTNTIYAIQYDFTLGEDITVPANCVLEFDGGSISGEYTITGQNTGIEAGLVKVFGIDVTIAGTWNVSEAYPEWFGAVGDGTTNDTTAIQMAINMAKLRGGIVKFSAKVYRAAGLVVNGNGVTIQGVRSTINSKGTIIQPIGTAEYTIKIGFDSGMMVGGLIRDIMISGNNTRQDKNDRYDGIGVKFNHVAEYNIENVFVSGFLKEGVYCNRYWDSKVEALEIRACGDVLTYPALRLTADSDSTNSIHFNALHIEECPFELSIEGLTSHIQFEGCKFEISGTDRNEIVESVENENTPHIIYVYEGVYAISFIGCFFALRGIEGSIGLDIRNNNTTICVCQFASKDVDTLTLIKAYSNSASYGNALIVSDCVFEKVSGVIYMNNGARFTNNTVVELTGKIHLNSKCTLENNIFLQNAQNATIQMDGGFNKIANNDFSDDYSIFVDNDANTVENFYPLYLVTATKPTIDFNKTRLRNKIIYKGSENIIFTSSDIVNPHSNSYLYIYNFSSKIVSIDSSLHVTGVQIQPNTGIRIDWIEKMQKWYTF